MSEPRRISLPVALKFPLKCFFLFFKEKNIPKLENKGNPLPPNHTKLTLGAWRESMETRKPVVNPVWCRRVGWERADPSQGPLSLAHLQGSAAEQRWGQRLLESVTFAAQQPLPLRARPWEAGEEGFMHSREAPGPCGLENLLGN